ncbi:MAG: hypothetical protein ACPF9D_07120 [Owenweeksia sp.]
MAEDNNSKRKALLHWCSTAILFSGAALIGNFLLTDVSEEYLSYIKCFAGGPVVAPLALEVFPQAFQKDEYWTGLAVTIGLVLALYLNTLGK